MTDVPNTPPESAPYEEGAYSELEANPTYKMLDDEGNEITSEELVERIAQMKEEVDGPDVGETSFYEGIVALDKVLEKANKCTDETEPAETKDPTPQYPASLIKELRKYDRPMLNKTCSICAKRQPLDKMNKGKADICVDCK